MNNEEAKLILSAYRPRGEDASDPVFEEALEQVRCDPELAAWFREERQRDGKLAEIFQTLPVPEETKRSLLLFPRLETVRKRRRFLWRTGVLAASLALLLAGAALLTSYLRPVPEWALPAEESIGIAELAGLVHAAMPLDFRGNSVPELRAWLSGRGAPVPDALPPTLGSLPALGCRVFADARGNAISLLCLEKDGQMVHLFVAEGKSREALSMAENEWIRHEGWNAYFWADGERAYVLFSLIPREELEALLI